MTSKVGELENIAACGSYGKTHVLGSAFLGGTGLVQDKYKKDRIRKF